MKIQSIGLFVCLLECFSVRYGACRRRVFQTMYMYIYIDMIGSIALLDLQLERVLTTWEYSMR